MNCNSFVKSWIIIVVAKAEEAEVAAYLWRQNKAY